MPKLGPPLLLLAHGVWALGKHILVYTHQQKWRRDPSHLPTRTHNVRYLN